MCPLVSAELTAESKIVQTMTEGAEQLVKTLDALNRNLSSDDEGWKSYVCGLSTTTVTCPAFRRTIGNVNYCFAGNCNITPYDGEISSEGNAEYNPFFLNYDSGKQQLTQNSSRNIFRSDDQWSSNGAIWKWSDEHVGWEIDRDNFNEDHNNATTKDLSVLSGDYGSVTDAIGSTVTTYENVE